MTAKTAALSFEDAKTVELSFEDAEVPATVRPVTVNPMSEVCRILAEQYRAGKTLAKRVGAADDKQVKSIKRWLSLSGKEHGVTFRSIAKDNTVTFWPVERIEHKRNNDKK